MSSGSSVVNPEPTVTSRGHSLSSSRALSTALHSCRETGTLPRCYARAYPVMRSVGVRCPLSRLEALRSSHEGPPPGTRTGGPQFRRKDSSAPRRLLLIPFVFSGRAGWPSHCHVNAMRHGRFDPGTDLCGPGGDVAVRMPVRTMVGAINAMLPRTQSFEGCRECLVQRWRSQRISTMPCLVVLEPSIVVSAETVALLWANSNL